MIRVKSNELRLGNIVKWNDSLVDIKIARLEIIENNENHEYEPIEISPEDVKKILLSQGFHYVYDVYKCTNIHYVHQLQNLVYSLTSKELIYNASQN